MNNSGHPSNQILKKNNQNIQVYTRIRPLNQRERCIRSAEVVEVLSHKEVLARHALDSKLTKKFTFDRVFGQESKQVEVYKAVVEPLIQEVLAGYNCTVFAYGQTGTGKTHTMIGNECVALKCSWDDDSDIGIIPRALCHLFDELRLTDVEFTMRISYLELYNEELCDLLSTDDNTKIRIYDDTAKKGSVIIQGLEEVPVYSKEDVYKLLEKGKERRKTATTLMNAQSSRSHTVFSIVIHIRDNGLDGEELLKIGKLNLVDLAGSENINKSGNEKGIRARETVNINQSLLTLGRVITALVERTPHIPYRESKLTRLLQESLGGRTKTSIIATISPGHKDVEETLSTLEYAHRAKNIQNKPEVNQKLTKKSVLKEYVEKIDKLNRDLIAAREKNGIYLAEETYSEMIIQMDSLKRELNEKTLLIKSLRDDLQSKEKLFNDVSLHLIQKTELLLKTEKKYSEMKKKQKRTRRRYLEKKLILDSRMKTEEILTKQATEIMVAADVATSDTEALHATIKRRKDVDIKMQSACEKFTERMQTNFQQLDKNMNTFEQEYTSFTNNIQEQLLHSSDLQMQQMNKVEYKLQTMNEMHEKYHQQTKEITENFLKAIVVKQNISKADTKSFVEQLLSIKEELSKDLQITLKQFKDDNTKQALIGQQMHDYIQFELQQQYDQIKNHNKETQEILSAIESCVMENCVKLENLQQNITKEYNLMEESIKRMRIIKDNLLNFEVGCNQVMNEVNKKQALDAKYLSEQEKFMEENSKKLNEYKENSELIKEECEKRYNNCKENNLHKTMKEQLVEFSENHNTVAVDVNELVEDYATDVKRIRLDYHQDMQSSINNDLKGIIKDNSQRIRNHLFIAKSLNDTLCGKVNDFGLVYKEQITNCINDMETFKQNEFKTYTATGETPSKRTFFYPKVLAKTSPDNKIIQRFNQERDWSELNTTVSAIDEESTILSDSEISGVHDQTELNGGTKILLNSTPLELNNRRASTPSPRSRSASSVNVTPNTSKSSTLKVTNKHNQQNHSQNDVIKHIANSSLSPKYCKSNKENLSTTN